MKKIQVSDVTLRVWAEEMKKELSFREKIAVANGLQKIGVNAVELPVNSGKEECVVCKTISEDLTATVTVCAGSNVNEAENVFSSVSNAKSKRLQVSVPVSTVQMEYAFHLKAPKMLGKIATMISDAKKICADVEFVAKDATRAEDGFLLECVKTACENGATVVTLCDDAGDCFPNEFAKIVKQIKEGCNVNLFVQPSDKLKMSSAIAVECIKAGADGIKTAINTRDYLSPDVLSEIIRAKGDELGVETDLDVTVIHKTVKAVADISQKASSGLEDNAKKNRLVFNGDCTLKDISDEIIALGYELSANDIGKVYEEFKRVCAKKGSIGELELEAIVASSAMQVPTTYHLVNYVVNSGNIITATANVTLEKEGVQMSGVSAGDGPIDAVFHAIEQIIGHHYELDDFNVSAVTKGREAVGSAIIRLRAEGKLYSGNGVSTDIVGACVRAYVNALNKIVYNEK